MDTGLFRKASLERLSSPEELDQVITISVSGGWAALIAILLFCAAAGVWGIVGRLPTTATGSGMIVSTGGVLTVVARGSGIVRSIDVAVGQHVEANQVLALIAQPALADRVRGMTDDLQAMVVRHQQDLKLKSQETAIRLEALARQRTNTERAIKEFQEQARLAAERIPIMEQLYAKGLVTNQQVLASREKLVELNGQVEDRAAQLKQFEAQAFELESQRATLDADAQLDVASRQRQIAAASSEQALQETVTTPYAGAVVEIKVSPGGSVGTGTPVLTIQPDADTLEVLTYVSSLQAKDIRKGLDARISPSQVKREEYGFMWGKVAFVADYPATAAAVMRNIQNDQLLQTLTGRGPVTEVRVLLDRDPSTASGFRWSSARGPSLRISPGTIVTAEIVTDRRAPISLVVPILRQTLGL
jgi:HlyD family secretion protein